MTSLDTVLEQSYRLVPFHDWNHGKAVHDALLSILWEKTWIAHILGGKLHDAGHGYIAQHDDEKNACTVSRTLLEKLWFPREVIHQVEFLIEGTIFRERWNLSDYHQMAIADADISSCGKDYFSFIKSTAKLYIESLPVSDYPSKEGILKFFKEQTLFWFFWFLTRVSGDSENPFLLPKNALLFPNFPKNRDQLANDLENNQDSLIRIVKSEWKNFYNRELILLEDIW